MLQQTREQTFLLTSTSSAAADVRVDVTGICYYHFKCCSRVCERRSSLPSSIALNARIRAPACFNCKCCSGVSTDVRACSPTYCVEGQFLVRGLQAAAEAGAEPPRATTASAVKCAFVGNRSVHDAQDAEVVERQRFVSHFTFFVLQ